MHGKRVRLTRYGRKPRSVVAALKQARDFLVAEGEQHWIKGTVLKVPKGTAAFDPNDPSCGDWGVCAVGAVALVTGVIKGMTCNGEFIGHTDYEDGGLYPKSVDELNRAASELFPHRGDVLGYRDRIIGVNDSKVTKRKDVIRCFDRAIELAGGKP